MDATEKGSFRREVLAFSGQALPKKAIYSIAWISGSDKVACIQIVNHGVPIAVMEEMLEGIRRFHEQPPEAKRASYSRDYTRHVNYYCCGDLKVRAKSAADWRDTLSFKAVEDQWDFEALPQVCRYFNFCSSSKKF
ncbi:1-aminocyclopropane-1-carboxylate oxidase homolog 5-like [Pyrus x bretschneideri]|uniref:1-aminocyclopropane-1-carboxylate oxidase homolog 5-like n=1 Tax=Pyrus x bretschneideri TaxID=225117 RepID=UPI00202E258D|nr:1-aminocyclopropane-1-carboxylate oxidase homolog 5-like [Pyrus x bretschneideri]